MPMAAILLLFLTLFSISKADRDFDVRQHLSTVTRYGAVKDIVDNSFIPSDIPQGCAPIHLNLVMHGRSWVSIVQCFQLLAYWISLRFAAVIFCAKHSSFEIACYSLNCLLGLIILLEISSVARHGTRSPTKKRVREMEKLASHIKELIEDAKQRNLSLQKVPAWFHNWESPWKGKLKGGELDIKGEEELYQLGIRVRERFPDIFNEEYHPDVYPVKTTQIPRASASAVAFGMGLFSGKGSLGPGRHRAFAVTSESRASDTILRFFECCQTYKDFRKNQEPSFNKLKEPILTEITSALAKRYEFNFTGQDISSLWFLCKQESSLLDITDQACSLFSPTEVALLEWTDDIQMFMVKGYGKSLNYRMGVPLLKDVLQSMSEAINADEDNQLPGSYEKARLRFAHAETVVPFSCLLGLFLEGSDFERIQKEEPLDLPPKPPQKRNWRGSIVAPFAGNNMLVLYSCPANSSSKYFVQVLHNEHPIPMPGCGSTDFCPFQVFKDKIVEPHFVHDYDTLCNAHLEESKHKPETSKLSQLFRWIFRLGGNDDTPSHGVEL
ncbi:multiple inositol polyphosphate phosphatase 1-like [Gossypium australe]|uniref:Multiple inositol polyphosphate phosphatase 1 n=1 Tax=Gossypium australe TaxID=47621 RepID=A0A5B6W9L9_9ROSI|nr:multiple inositol polyphosphate phosphatase 1-like [Gossypium australe]